ncbi:hypothetical protein A3D80_01645 [Candidatus Roizmanbacteria bacterium RIFCSPHIGHO2_02_FULL_40_13b]|uniref:Uncharacterized protein n=1 Tax=Candidatus Roizmanbacteria bacterium RIFCSPHIGHO2_01_FULL_39_24 TaxID=1802032 RepID=A0A1F7GI50_9BACT|nr:MAG: hypothetical protein A2799_02920 [Candidatus Roizmanbacteria bacterium RIFCSPHIGHO2_01_FULL_39_24]OGK26855.1 MAG: hypothetical protein A3D80_01645 [Candidatus Roizmanbacteria bacterium RIFCSPHIGHO2_02_FULL_40_13b]OGK57402.1 MAG: hypothetical protein A3H83_04110 [Candidatus Roizmanbacteria bacterium RIFCSPLOWO2_02_FULL_39_8]
MIGSVYAQIEPLAGNSCLSPEGVATIKCMEVIARNLLFIASTFVLLILFVMLVVGAIKYITSGGEPEKLQGAQNTLKFAIIGTALFIGSFLILNTIQVLFLGGAKGDTSLFKFTIPEYKP